MLCPEEGILENRKPTIASGQRRSSWCVPVALSGPLDADTNQQATLNRFRALHTARNRPVSGHMSSSETRILQIMMTPSFTLLIRVYGDDYKD